MKVIGISGIYFQSPNPARLKAWYEKHLGVGSGFSGMEVNKPDQPFQTEWSPLDATDRIFAAGKKEFAISYRVDDLKAMLASFKVKAINVEERSDGSAILLDPEGNTVMLVQAGGKTPQLGSVPSDRVTGLGGVFFKAADVKNLKAWYSQNLSLDITEWGCSFEWIDPKDADAKVPATTAWSTFESTTTYFAPSQKEFMFNYRVKDLIALLAALKSEGVESVADPQEFSYGKFGWIVDPEGNKMELWEPIDGGF